ncbi:MAG: glycosyltransferase family 4 protein, partial [Candidatus Brocadiia bacterium]|nr:glycosyltransferase family 4 protein [Candidatus Brocadiia bacterium]
MAATELQDGIAFISTFPPRQCGIGTFCNSLVSACAPHTGGRLRMLIAAVDDPRADYDYPELVRHRIDEGNRVNYVEAAEFLNFNNVRAVSLQHEFGLFGGADGAYVLDLLRELRCPIITTCHTILDAPSPGQREVMKELIVLSQRLVVMTRLGSEFLRDVYAAPPEKILVIPHGVPELPLVEPDHYKAQFGVEGRPVVLTFGLLSKGKGIEYALRALPPIVKEYPNLCYIVLGATHPNVVAEEGESYRLSLQRLARELGLQKNVLFVGRFVEQGELCEFLKAADIYVTPYLNREQITSGTLAYALGAGKPIVSTRYWHAEELLADGRGALVDFKDPEAISDGLLGILRDPGRMREMRANAYEHSRPMVWREVGRRYVGTFREAMSTARVRAGTLDASMRRLLPITGLPRPRLEHLVRMTDDTGILQHARHNVPNRHHGYTTDDNARALLVATKFHNLFRREDDERLLNVYLSFIQYAQREDGLFRNFMGYDRRFLEEVGSDDCLGRALWGLGYVVHRGPVALARLATELFEESISRHSVLLVLSARARAYTILGLYYYLQRYPEAHDIENKIDAMADKNLGCFRAQSRPD